MAVEVVYTLCVRVRVPIFLPVLLDVQKNARLCYVTCGMSVLKSVITG